MADEQRSKIIRSRDYRWDVPLREYKSEGTHFRDITRQTLLGEGSARGRAELHYPLLRDPARGLLDARAPCPPPFGGGDPGPRRGHPRRSR
ncbi:MAG: hypothetical protein U5L11_09520 [Arhodomonas sp.]|nr:hypothetical protein [Arhodomonas sp.]